MQTGIIGLRCAGKTTVFRILTGTRGTSSTAQDDTHIGVATVPDARLERLASLFRPRRITHATLEVLDVAALAGEGGRDTALLARLREVDAILHVVRAFDNPACPPPDGRVHPREDMATVELDLLLNDLDQAERRLERIEKELKKRRDARLETERNLLQRCVEALGAQRPLRELDVSPEEEKILAGFGFLSRRPLLYVVNLDDRYAPQMERALTDFGLAPQTPPVRTALVPLCGRIEAELAELTEPEAAELMGIYGLVESGRSRLLRTLYELLGLISFFTVGEKECRAWTIRRGTRAAEVAGVIHSDFERGFIRAEVIGWQELLAAGSWAAAREAGQVRLQGRDYVVQDGDVLLIRHSS
jgi:GTP-binding protein YchF